MSQHNSRTPWYLRLDAWLVRIGPVWGMPLVIALALVCALSVDHWLLAQSISIPNTFVNGTTADATQVNANFTALSNGALNRTGGTMTGTLNARDVLPVADNTYALGSAAFKWKLPFIAGGTAGQFLQAVDGAGTTGWATVPYGDLDCGRLTLTSGTPVTSADVTAATNVYFALDGCDQISLYDGSALWNNRTFAELTLAVPATTSQMYDVFIYDSSGTPAIEALAWTNDTTRATALVRQNGRYVKTGATTRRYVGSFRTTTVSGQTEDSQAKRYLWNAYHRQRRPMRVLESTANWVYTTATLRQARGTLTNQLDFIVGLAEAPIDAMVFATAANDAGTMAIKVSIGYDSTTVEDADVLGRVTNISGANTANEVTARLLKYSAVGRHTLVWLEYSQASGNTTWYGNGAGGTNQSGIHGFIEG